jgi:hypothetical protein
VRQTRANRKRRACTLLVSKATVERSAKSGRSRVAFSGRIRRKALEPGHYVIQARAVDAAGNASAIRRLTATIVRR